MANGAELRQALAVFLGVLQYRKFVQQGINAGQMRYWQEQAWNRFTDAHPEYVVDLGELVAALRVCHLHGDELRSDTTEVFQGCTDLAQSYVAARNRLFPSAAQDVISTEGRPIDSDPIGVWFCPLPDSSCCVGVSAAEVSIACGIGPAPDPARDAGS
jgi:hypothetical protein